MSVYSREEKLFCEEHYKDKFVPRCAKCNDFITEVSNSPCFKPKKGQKRPKGLANILKVMAHRYMYLLGLKAKTFWNNTSLPKKVSELIFFKVSGK